jgi:RNA polymerase sigma factor (sigma-70 family)
LVSDTDLIEMARAGDDSAFAELWRRHAAAAKRYAVSITRRGDADDIVSEAFAKIFGLIKRGKGPTNGFRAYLAVTIKHTSEHFGRARRETPIDFADDLADERTDDAHQSRALDRSLTITAFKSLPQRWQEALWYSEVEQLSVTDCAEIFGIKPAAMAMLTFRAREGLRQAWIQAHIAENPNGSEHQWVIEHLGAHARRGLAPSREQRLNAHLGECDRCALVAEEARYVGSRLALGLLVPLIGVGAASAYIASSADAASAATASAAEGLPSTHSGAGKSLRARATSQIVIGAIFGVATVAAATVAVVGLISSTSVRNPQPQALAGVVSPRPPIKAIPSTQPTTTSPSQPLPTPSWTVSADMGMLHLFYPELHGTAPAGSTIEVFEGQVRVERLTVAADGRWSTRQLTLKGTETLSVTAGNGTWIQRRSVAIELSAPTVTVTKSSAGLEIAVTGAPGAPFTLTSSAGTVGADTLNASGSWTGTYSTDSFDPSSVKATYRAGSRFGPPSR